MESTLPCNTLPKTTRCTGNVPLRKMEFARSLAAESCAKRAMEHGVRKVDVLVRGPGSGRETAIRSLAAVGIEVVGIKDVTPIPHNGCRPKKRRRV